MKKTTHEVKCLDAAHGDDWSIYQADCVDFTRQLPSNSVDFSVYSPPFANLYTYSDSERDMGNCKDDREFIEHYGFFVDQLHRVLRPGRLAAVHCKDLVYYKGSSESGMAGLRDFSGELIRAHEKAGFALHSKVTIWKDPVVEMQRTKAHGLLYKTLRADSSFSRQGMPEYLLIFRKWATEETQHFVEPVRHTREDFPLDQWQEWASPVWTTIDQTNVLNVAIAREDKDEKHLCPLQIDVIDRALVMWSNPGDVVFSPFTGIGSEGVQSLKAGRKFVGTELKAAYFQRAADNLRAAMANTQLSLFGSAAQ